MAEAAWKSVHEASRRAAWRLARRAGGWARVAADARAAVDRDPRLRSLGRAGLENWLAVSAATTWGRPTEEQRRHIATALPLDEQYPRMYQPGTQVPVMPTSLSLRKHVWWGAGSRDTAVWAAQKGVNLMSSTLLTEANGDEFADLQADQLRLFRQAWKEAGHPWTPRTSVSRSIFPILSETDRRMFGTGDDGGVGYIDDSTATFGRTYADEPDRLIEELKKDAAVMEADTLMLTIPSQLGVDANLRILSVFADHVAPELGWEPNTAGPVTGYPIP